MSSSFLLGPLSFVFAIVVMLGVLVTIHEFGHFIVAKWCGVRVLKFSIGFGPAIGFGRFRLRWERGGTEYVVAWVPLGGFVRILGEHTDGETDESELIGDGTDHLGAKPLWQKLAIYFAGPAMNLALPIVIFAGFLAVGMPRPLAVVGTVEPASPAEAAGLEPGDRITAVGGEPLRWWDELDALVRARPGEPIRLAVERGDRALELTIRTQARSGLDEFGGVAEIGWLGLAHARLRATVGIPSGEAPAIAAGLRTEDVVTHVDGEPVEDWASFARDYAAAGRTGEVEITVERAAGEETEAVTVRAPALGSVEALGVVPATALITQVTPDSPAERAGLEAGDLIVAVDGKPVGTFGSFAEMVRSSGGRELAITYARSGVTRTVGVAAALDQVDNELGFEEEIYRIGIAGGQRPLPGIFVDDVERNPLASVPRAVDMTVERTQAYLRGLGKLLTGELSRKQLAGPIGIGVIAHKALQQGWDVYLSMMVLISINLGILNLLPIPVLDGGQIVLYTVEGVKRSPVSLRTRELIQTVGIAVIVMLMGFAIWNDVSRYWGKFLDYVRATAGL